VARARYWPVTFPGTGAENLGMISAELRPVLGMVLPDGVTPAHPLWGGPRRPVVEARFVTTTVNVAERVRGHPVTDASKPADRSHKVTSDLVEYVIVAVPDQDSLATVVPALAELVQTAKIRILDLVVLLRDDAGAVTVREFEAVESMAALRRVEGEVGGLLSERDIALASIALRPGTAGIVLVTEDRWAEPLSAAARRAGGQIIAGERIPPPRVEGALADRSEDEQEGG
jgi:hypothetical protein